MRFISIGGAFALLMFAGGVAEAQQSQTSARDQQTLRSAAPTTALHQRQVGEVKTLTRTFQTAHRRGQSFATIREDVHDLECTGSTGAEIAACQEACLVLQDASDAFGGGYGCSSNDNGCSCSN